MPILVRIIDSERVGVQDKVVFSFRLSTRVTFGTIFRVRNGAEICVRVGVRVQFRVRVLGRLEFGL